MTSFRIGAAAGADIVGLLAWTHEQFGEAARRRYEALLSTALHDIAADPRRPGSAARPELGPDLRSYHLRYSRIRARRAGATVSQPRHLILYRPEPGNVIAVIRVLHDAMELERHLPPEDI